MQINNKKNSNHTDAVDFYQHFINILRANQAELRIRIAPIGYAFLVFCGALYFHFYYETFHIPIFRYLDLSEIAVSFLPIIIVIIMYLGYIVCYLALIKLFIPIIKSCKKINVKKNFMPPSLKKRYALLECFSKIDRNLFLTIFLASICAGYLFLSYKVLDYGFTFSENRDYWWYGLLICSVTILLFLKTKFLTINLMIIFVIAVVHQSINEVKDTLDNPIGKICTIITDNDTIITNDSLIYIGRTNNYIFLYKPQSGFYKDIPTSRVNEFSLKDSKKNSEKFNFFTNLKDKILRWSIQNRKQEKY